MSPSVSLVSLNLADPLDHIFAAVDEFLSEEYSDISQPPRGLPVPEPVQLEEEEEWWA